MSNLSEDKINTQIVPGESAYINNTSYFIPDRSKLNAIVKEMFSDYLLNKSGSSQVDTDKNKNNTNTKNNNNKNNNTNNRNNSNNNKNNNNKNNKNNKNNNR